MQFCLESTFYSAVITSLPSGINGSYSILLQNFSPWLSVESSLQILGKEMFRKPLIYLSEKVNLYKLKGKNPLNSDYY